MNATSDLRSEHGGVARMLGIMDAIARRIRAGETVDEQDRAQVIEFLREFVDGCHHTKEEQLLFPALDAEGVTSVRETVVALLAEHVEGRAAVTVMAEAEGAELAEAMERYTELLRHHIRREEADCFDVADRELPAPVQDELAEGYDRIEREVVGEGRHEAFHALLDRLQASYRP